MRVMGGLLMLAGSLGFGGCMSAAYIRKIHILREAKEMLEFLIAQIRVENSALPESICNVSVRIDGIFAQILQNMEKNLRENAGKPLFEIWREEAAVLEDGMGSREYEMLLHLFDQSGFYDSETQLLRLSQTLDAFRKEIEKREAQKEQRCRLYQSMGFMVGIFMIILLW